MKQILLTLLGVLLALPALARDFEYTYEGQTLTYTVIDEDAKTCMTKDGYYDRGWHPGNRVRGKLIIPAVAKYGNTEYSVTKLGYSAFYECSDLTSVTIPNSVTFIGSEAFYGCRNLIVANFASIESMCAIEFESDAANPLYYAKHLYFGGKEVTEVVIPESLTSIGN
ncbi:MAG: leucine-rich repeat domain-containing protein, partial [Duncaniella sp.]|nr:leucine-rich repeat domain-containing protein [Duncaniella sp.]